MWHEIPEHVPRDKTEPFPIGKPCDHFKATVIDNEGNRCNPGEEGELLIAGPFMDGYWGNEELTKEVFFEDENTKRWYKTGDLVKELKDGSYQFLGRKDRMVKRRGFRVELGEIEAALYTHPAMTEVAVIAVPDEENGVLVKAFLCLSDKGFASLVKMKMYCSEKLPNYMVPDTFSFHDELPKTSTDKIDYQSLR